MTDSASRCKEQLGYRLAYFATTFFSIDPAYNGGLNSRLGLYGHVCMSRLYARTNVTVLVN